MCIPSRSWTFSSQINPASLSISSAAAHRSVISAHQFSNTSETYLPSIDYLKKDSSVGCNVLILTNVLWKKRQNESKPETLLRNPPFILCLVLCRVSGVTGGCRSYFRAKAGHTLDSPSQSIADSFPLKEQFRITNQLMRLVFGPWEKPSRSRENPRRQIPHQKDPTRMEIFSLWGESANPHTVQASEKSIFIMFFNNCSFILFFLSLGTLHPSHWPFKLTAALPPVSNC